MPRSHKMLDTMELPPVHRRIFRVILRARAINFPDLCTEAADLPDGMTATPEAIKNALADMIDSGLVQTADLAGDMVYRISLGENTDNTQTTSLGQNNDPAFGSIWDQLDVPPKTRM